MLSANKNLESLKMPTQNSLLFQKFHEYLMKEEDRDLLEDLLEEDSGNANKTSQQAKLTSSNIK